MTQPKKTIRHFNVPGHAHFLIFSCYKNFPLLKRKRTRKWFIQAVLQAKSQHNIAIWAYVIMPDHAHLLVYPLTPEYNIALFLKSVKQSVARKAKHYLREYNKDWLEKLTTTRGSRKVFNFWQTGPGHDRNITSDEELLNKINYIHNNPAKKGLVANPDDWEWSSAQWYKGRRKVPLPMDNSQLHALTGTNKFVHATF